MPVKSTIEMNEAPDVNAILGEAPEAIDFEEMVRKMVAEKFDAASLNQSNPVVEADTRSAQAHRPPAYLKHYRCDLSPDATIQKRFYDESTDSLTGLDKGNYIRFRRGHFFATEQEEVDQLEWMMRNTSVDPRDVNRVIGGMPSIYEDDGQNLTLCKYGCGETFIIGSNSYKAHIRATHGVAS